MIKEIKQPPNQAVIEMCENLLEQAQSGFLRGIAVAGSTLDGCTFNQYTFGNYKMAMVGELHILCRDVIDAEIDLRKCPSC